MRPPEGSWQGTCGFRLMPHEDLGVGPSHATVTGEADGHGWSLRYTWPHPQDGEQTGVLLVGSPAEHGAVTAGWLDSWHQKPEVRLLTGAGEGDSLSVETQYNGWTWQIRVAASEDTLAMTMHNVIPEGTEQMAPGPYVVMEAHWELIDQTYRS